MSEPPRRCQPTRRGIASAGAADVGSGLADKARVADRQGTVNAAPLLGLGEPAVARHMVEPRPNLPSIGMSRLGTMPLRVG